MLLATSTALTKPDPRQNQQDRPDSKQFRPERPEKRHFPKHWGKAPEIQTKDMVKLPGKFGMGSSTLASWIRENLKKDANKDKPEIGKPKPRPKPPIKPIRPKRPEPSVDVKERIAIVMEKEKEMIEIRKSFHDTLKASKDMTKEKREELIRSFKEANAEKHKALKEAQKELQKKIRETKQTGKRRI